MKKGSVKGGRAEKSETTQVCSWGPSDGNIPSDIRLELFVDAEQSISKASTIVLYWLTCLQV